MKAHELVGLLNPDSSDYKNVMASVKFDLGDSSDANALLNASHRQINKLPAPISLFQIEIRGVTQIYLAAQTDAGIVWQGWIEFGGLWEACPYEVLIDTEDIFSLRRVDGKPMSESDVVSRISTTFAQSCIAVCNAIEVFSCCNVALAEHVAPKFINAKRIAKGRVPFFSYRTLHIKWDTPQKVGNEQGGTHASPRLHLRRGHIRTLPDDRKIWVRASLVGDKSKGFAQKDYAVNSLAQQLPAQSD